MSKPINGEKYLQDKGAPRFNAKNHGFLEWLFGTDVSTEMTSIALNIRHLKGCSLPIRILNQNGSIDLMHIQPHTRWNR